MSNYDITLKFDLSKKLCDDEMIGTLEHNKGEYEFKLRDDYETEIIRPSDYNKYPYTISNYKKLVVVLESPHIDEFKCELGNRPANGQTGKKFRKNFDLIINNKYSSRLQPDNYIIYLVNSIQYQCSLGVKTDLFRDYVWLESWKKKDIRESFVERINKINPDVIINCCTEGGHKRDYSNGYISLNECARNTYIKENFIKALDYEIQKLNKKNIIKYNKFKMIKLGKLKRSNLINIKEVKKYNLKNTSNYKICLLEYKKVKEITLKNFVKYQIENECKFIKKPNNYFELPHPSSWI
ncbi:hypothetical protein NSA42_03170 [Paeniclostridium sordellii]|uniref:hypothetical protein n=1 Tax=Paraclostridium sordellii TaxID=1505 RepID=UPI00214A5AAA|nr:hypothetical protein [Paeniclostridium sordellii]MCR1848270.1 hypothetical protein [Paeniclostridium sordellii]